MSTVVHLTTAHGPFDTRIFHKEAKSLVEAGYDVTLLVHHEVDETVDGVHIESLGNADSRVDRWQSIPEAYRRAKSASADVYHFHDPELLPVGLALSRLTSGKVIYDAHENFQAKLTKRQWIPTPLRPILSRAFPSIQNRVVGQLDAVVAATDWVAEPLRQSNADRVVTIRNFPLTNNISISDEPPAESEHDYTLIYVGGLRKNRGLFTMVDLIDGLRDRGLDVGLWLIGPSQSDSDERQFHRMVEHRELRDHVRLFGWIDYPNIFGYLMEADLGLALLNPSDAKGAIPTKMFDYLYANVPIIASETPAVDAYLPEDCGRTVPYDDTRTQVETARNILEDRESGGIGTTGRAHVEEKYNWEVEKDRLLNLYDSLL